MANPPILIDETDFTPLFTGKLRTDGRVYTVGFVGKSNIDESVRFLAEAVDGLPKDEKSFLFKKSRAFFEKLHTPGSESRVLSIICNGRLVAQSIINQPGAGEKTGMTDMQLPGPPEKLSIFQGVCVAEDLRGNDLMGVMITAWIDHAARSKREHAVAEADIRNAASWSSLMKRGLTLVSIGIDTSDASAIYNAHGEVAKLSSKQAFNKAAGGDFFACRTDNIEKQQDLYRQGYKAVAHNRTQHIFVFHKP